MRADGSGQRQLTSGAELDSRRSSRPNGKLRRLRAPRRGRGRPRDLYTVSLGGGGLHALTTGADDDHEAVVLARRQAIVFVRSVAETGGGTADDIYSVRPSGAGLARLTTTGRIDEFAPALLRRRHRLQPRREQRRPGAYADIYTMRAQRQQGRKRRSPAPARPTSKTSPPTAARCSSAATRASG